MKLTIRMMAVLILAICVSGVSRVSAQTVCSLSTLNSSYGFSASGFVPVPVANGHMRFEPFAIVGLAKFDGAGNIFVTIKGEGPASMAYKGTYKMDATCAGTATFSDGGGNPTMRWDFVVVDSGSAIETLALLPKIDTRPAFSTNFKQEKI